LGKTPPLLYGTNFNKKQVTENVRSVLLVRILAPTTEEISLGRALSNAVPNKKIWPDDILGETGGRQGTRPRAKSVFDRRTRKPV